MASQLGHLFPVIPPDPEWVSVSMRHGEKYNSSTSAVVVLLQSGDSSRPLRRKRLRLTKLGLVSTKLGGLAKLGLTNLDRCLLTNLIDPG